MTTSKRFAVCVDNQGCEASLIAHKIYPIIPDEKAEQDDFIRIVDESGEDYLHHSRHFVSIELPEEVERVLVAA